MEIKTIYSDIYNNVDIVETTNKGDVVFFNEDGEKKIIPIEDIRYISHEMRGGLKKGGKFKRVNAPMFNVDGITLNEYELRQLCVDIKNGEQPIPNKMIDGKGDEFTIDENGNFSKPPYGIDLSYKLVKELF